MKKKSLLLIAIVLILSGFVFWNLVYASSVGPTFPGTGANNNTYAPFETNAWVNPGNITANDGNYARAISPDGQDTNYLQASNFGFSIPAGATINGITLVINKRNASPNTNEGICNDSLVQLVTSSGSINATNKADFNPSHWLATFSSITYGSSSDLWGASWSASDINSSNFGAVFAANIGDPDGGGSPTCDVDYMTVTVAYTPIPPVPSPRLQIRTGKMVIATGNVVIRD